MNIFWLYYYFVKCTLDLQCKLLRSVTNDQYVTGLWQYSDNLWLKNNATLHLSSLTRRFLTMEMMRSIIFCRCCHLLPPLWYWMMRRRCHILHRRWCPPGLGVSSHPWRHQCRLLLPGIQKQPYLCQIKQMVSNSQDSSICRAQWLRGRTSDSQLREPGFESWLRC